MDNQLEGYIGAWLLALGANLCAIISTPPVKLDVEVINDLNLIGNVLQATGYALQADGIGEVNLEAIGNEIAAIGTLEKIPTFVFDYPQDTENQLLIQGNLLSALGSFVVFTEEAKKPIVRGQILINIGDFLQGIGSSMQAVGIARYPDQPNAPLILAGNWVLAIGTTLALLGSSKQIII